RVVETSVARHLRAANRNLDAHAVRIETAFGDGNRQTAVRAIVRGAHQPRIGERDEEILQRALTREIDLRRHAAHDPVRLLQILGATELAATLAEEDDGVARFLEAPADDFVRLLQQTDHADGRRRIDRLAIRLVVEADVAAGDRHVERTTSLADPFDG